MDGAARPEHHLDQCPAERRLLDRLRDRQPLRGLLAALRAAEAELQPVRPPRRADRRQPARPPLRRAGTLAAPLDPRPQGGRPSAPLPRQRRPRAGRVGVVRRTRVPFGGHRARAGGCPAAVRARRRHVCPARALDPAAQLPGALRRPRLARTRAGNAPLRPRARLARRARGGARARAAAGAVRRRGDDDRSLARCPARAPSRPGARARDGDRARGRPRDLPGRARLDRQDLDRPPP